MPLQFLPDEKNLLSAAVLEATRSFRVKSNAAASQALAAFPKHEGKCCGKKVFMNQAIAPFETNASAPLWIGNGQTVLPDRVCPNGSVLVQNGRIIAVNRPRPEGAAFADAQGGTILPGFIDIHLHGGGGADFMDAEPDSFSVVARMHCQHGTTAMCPTTMTCGDDALEKVIAAYLNALKQPTGGAELLGLHLEGPYLSCEAKGAQPVFAQRVPTREALERVIRLGKGHILRWDAAPELPNMDVFIRVMREFGIMASVAHTNATASQAMAAFNSGFSHVTHLYSGTSTGRKIDRISQSGVNEATLLRDDISIELIADGRHIPKEHMLVAYRFKGPDNLALITDAMRAAGTNVRRSILGAKDGGVPVVISEDVAQLPDYSFYAGSIGTMDRALRVAHVQYGIPLVETSRMLSLTPARLMRCDDRKGSLEIGKDADVVVMDEEFSVRQVFVGGVLCHQAC